MREPDNHYDANAIRAEIRGKQVGYLARQIAAQVAPPLDQASVTSFSVCGVIRGGSVRAPNLGVHVWLDRLTSPGPEIHQLDSSGDVSWPPRPEERSVL